MKDPSKRLELSLANRGSGFTPEQCRRARVGLGLGMCELARLAGSAPSTVTGFEVGRTRGSAETRAAIKRALEDAGAVFGGEDDQDEEVGFKADKRRRRRPKQ